MKKIIISLMVFLMTPLIAQADGHETSGPGEGSFTTFMVQAPDVSAYIKYLKNNPELFSGFDATAAGVCVTITGQDYHGEMFVWSAYADVTGAMAETTAYDPDQAPKELADLRTPKYRLAWKPLKSFVLALHHSLSQFWIINNRPFSVMTNVCFFSY